MKRVLLAVLFATLLAPLAALAQPKDRVVVALRLEPPGLDPTMQAAAAVSEVTFMTVFEGLTRVNEKGEVLPDLAESWTSTGNKVYTFKLRRGVVFHDGSPFDSAVVAFALQRNAASESTNKRKRVFTNIDKIDTPDPLTVRISLKEPSSLLPFFLAEATAAMVHPKSAAANMNTPVGTGPYKFGRWVRGSSLTVEKFAQHRNAAGVAIPNVTYRFITDDSAQVAAMLAGDVDYVPLLGSLDAVDRFRSDNRFQVIVGSTEGETLMSINNKQKPFDDVRVRRAVNFAIDRNAIIQAASNGFGKPIASHATTANPYYVDLTGMYPHDPAKAKALLAEAGFPNGFDVAFKLPPQSYARRSGEVIVSQLAQVGIRAKIEPIEWAQWLEIVFKQKNYAITVIMQPEPWDLLNYTNPDYFYRYDNAEFRELMKKVENPANETERIALVKEAQRKLADDAVNAWLYEFPKVSIAKVGLEGIWKNLPMAVYDIAVLRWK